ncbi:LysR family transcriptional regulator [Pseudomonas corrugata]|uniref:LysR family transcriptional regulator n=1 Tax=Pseudomonas corrugata TaxID=47879 RepID=A0A7Y6DGG4_9PSED|nr:LysR family transcriptional regulator [Pseudomonas corrugata]MCI0995116.1 LysR family transcriptional regulator [Pseudomonas corrugata]NUT66456.1 LysR family transcriptional regulator [Pseudomonas corrugata]NUT86158.1 LysR family transcriptional regulator [Pseudomonas corrugata]
MRADFLDGIVVFTRVAQKRSFTAAALELGVTPAAVSWSIKRLEARVGMPLLARTTRSVGLTEAGKVFLEQVETGMAHIGVAFDAAQRFGLHPRGLLRLSVPYVAQPLIEPMLPGFTAAYPEVELELVFEDRYVDIVAEGYDAGIRIGDMIAQDMVGVRLGRSSPLTVVGSPGYFAKRGKPQHPDQLGEHACINIRLVSGALYRWGFVEQDAEGTPRVFAIDVKGPMIVNGPATSLAAAVSGVGLAYNISSNVQPLIDQGLLEPCLDTFMPESPGFFAYFPHRNQVLPKLRAFLDFCSEKNRADARTGS